MNGSEVKNSEILFIYDAKLCNPNGDPDEENKPRMDYDTSRNLVSDVRLKRYIRDYLMDKGYQIWVSKLEDQTVDATKKLQVLAKQYQDLTKKTVDITKPDAEFINWLLETLIDVRLFGATMPRKGGGGERGGGIAFTGPVQFSWGYSLNPAEIVPSSTITSTFAGRGEEYGTMGKDWRVYYSLIAFYGIVNRKRAEKTKLSNNDVLLLDNILIKAIPSEATTRSKLGQTSRLLLRIEYANEFYIGDLRRYVSIRPLENKDITSLRDINDFELDITNLTKILFNKKSVIEKIYLWKHPELKLKREFEGDLRDKIQLLPHMGNI